MVQCECERRFEFFVKMQKKFRRWGSGSGEGRVWGGGMSGWISGGGGRAGDGGGGWLRVDVDEEVKFL